MTVILSLLLTAVISFLVSFYTTPVARDAARRFGVIDTPDGDLKVQDEGVPYFGGLAIYLSFLIGISLGFRYDSSILGILLGGSIIAMVGLIDDLGRLTPGAKLTGEVIAVYVLVKSGVLVEIAYLPLPLQVIVTFFWMILMINAFNLIDVMDGLSAGVAMVAALFMLTVSVINKNMSISILSLSLAAALAGFLPYNFHKASIYMGDCGSLLVGFLLGAFSMVGKYSEHNHIALIAPAVIFGVPLFETIFVSYIRMMRGESIFRGSQDHFSLRLRKWKLTIPQTVITSYGASIVCGASGIFIMISPLGIAALVLALFSLLVLVIGIWLKKIDMTM